MGNVSVDRSRPWRLVMVGILAVVSALWVVWFLHSLALALRHRQFIQQYDGNQWFVSYSHGFVRRGFPGEVLDLISEPSAASIRIAGWCITLGAIVAAMWLVWSVVRRHAQSGLRAVALLLLVIYPLTLGSVYRNAERYDEIGIIVLAFAVALLNSRRIGGWAALLILGALAAVAVGCEEFLLLYIAPFVVISARRLLTTTSAAISRIRVEGRRLAVLTGVTLLPAFAVVALSVIRRPSEQYLLAIQRASGHAPAEHTAALMLRLTMVGQITYSYDYSGGARYTALTIAIWLTLYLVGVSVLRSLVDVAGAWYWRSAAYCAGVAVAMNIVFVDARRWWTLAFLTHLALAAVMGTERPAVSRAPSRRRFDPRSSLVLVAMVLSVVALQLPLTTIHPEDLSTRGYWTSLADSWIPGPNATYVRWIRNLTG